MLVLRNTPARHSILAACVASAAALALTSCAASPPTKATQPRTATSAAAAAITSTTPTGAVAASSQPDIHQLVTNETPALLAEGIKIVDEGPNPATRRENILVPNLTPSIANTLNNLFGPSNVTLSATEDGFIHCGCAATAVTPGITVPVQHAP